MSLRRAAAQGNSPGSDSVGERGANPSGAMGAGGGPGSFDRPSTPPPTIANSLDARPRGAYPSHDAGEVAPGETSWRQEPRKRVS